MLRVLPWNACPGAEPPYYEEAKELLEKPHVRILATNPSWNLSQQLSSTLPDREWARFWMIPCTAFKQAQLKLNEAEKNKFYQINPHCIFRRRRCQYFKPLIWGGLLQNNNRTSLYSSDRWKFKRTIIPMAGRDVGEKLTVGQQAELFKNDSECSL